MTSLSDPAMPTSAKTAAFWDRMARAYAAKPVANLPAWEATLERTRAHLRPEDTVLELGCGTGSSALKLAASAASYTATDISPEMIAIAREKPEGRNLPHLSFRVFEAGGAPAGPFDAVIAFNLMHLIPDMEAAIAGIRARLRPGGLFISKTGCLGPLSPIRPVVAAMRLVGKAPYVRFLSPAACDAMIVAAGFEIVETGGYPKRANRFVVARRL